uniref:Uncharacterized protein n=1 Tax=Trichuris muris TaxID=70415 RepID=A0A5S6Q9K6_TRIMR
MDVIVSEGRPLGFDLVLRIHAIRCLGGMFLDRRGGVQLGPLHGSIRAAAEAEIRVEGAEFITTYEPTLRSWTAAWKWTNGCAPDILHNTKEQYPPAAATRAAYEKELQSWVQNGWVVPYDQQRFGPARALIALMAVIQRTKGKVRPVFDFRELNGHNVHCQQRRMRRQASGMAPSRHERVAVRSTKSIPADPCRGVALAIPNSDAPWPQVLPHPVGIRAECRAEYRGSSVNVTSLSVVSL